MDKRKRIAILLFCALFSAGLFLFLYPSLHGAVVDHEIAKGAASFFEQVTPQESPVIPTEIVEDATPLPEQLSYPELLADMKAYNATIYEEKQKELSCEYAYRTPSFTLKDYGLASEIFGVLSVPAVGIEMPIYLGATDQHMAAGAAHLSQTSLPVVGENTNCVIAGHRGWKGADYFRHIDQLSVGDEVVVTNLWETLTYTVTETRIILPDDIDQVLIQNGRELLTLLTCHPYASGGKYRFLVICERDYGMQ